ncbi:hypothetical protein LCGC14_2947270, partial [marine sediment metagenome]
VYEGSIEQYTPTGELIKDSTEDRVKITFKDKLTQGTVL